MKQSIAQLFCCALLLCGCSGGTKTDSGWSNVVGVETMVVADGSAASEREYVGSIGSEQQIDVSFPLGGTLKRVNVRNGQHVSKGQLLAEIDATTAISLHNTAKATLRQAEDAYKRMKSVHEEGGISEVRWVQMETDLEKARQSEVAARKRVEDCSLYAPIDGVVSCGDHHVGQEMHPSELFARVIDFRRLCVQFSVPEQEVGLIPIGTKATATIPSLDNRELELRVSNKSLTANPLGHTYLLTATILSPTTEALLPDMVAKVNVALAAVGGIVVPAGCVQVMPEGTAVWVVSGGKASRRIVGVGDFVSNGVVVVEGLSVGDTVVVKGQQKLYTGALVKEQ